MPLIGNIIAIACMILGFGFVVFWHELGHFMAAKWVGIKVEQFAVGFGHAVLAWRKGVGIRVGSTRKEYEAAIRQHVARQKGLESVEDFTPAQEIAASRELGLGETEYRLNWLPLGGYVKMLGQDDMNPNAQSEDPRAYNRKSIGARMVVVSAGVIMNVILAFFLFVALFLLGFKSPPPVVGNVLVDSPAQVAGLLPGDWIIEIDGHPQYQFNGIALNTALAKSDVPMHLTVRRGQKTFGVDITPGRPGGDPKQMRAMGVSPAFILAAPPVGASYTNPDGSALDKSRQLVPGDTIVAVNGQSVTLKDFAVLDAAIQSGSDVAVTVKDAAGSLRTFNTRGEFQSFFGPAPQNLLGLQPRPQIEGVMPDAAAAGHLKPGDVVTSLRVNGSTSSNPSTDQILKHVENAGDNGWGIELTVIRAGQSTTVGPIEPKRVRGAGKKLGVGLGIDEASPFVSNIIPASPAAAAGIPRGSKILRVNAQPVSDWHDLLRLLAATPGPAAQIEYIEVDSAAKPTAAPKTATIPLADADRQALARVRYTIDLRQLPLVSWEEIRHTGNPIVAAKWGTAETRDMLLQFYVMLNRLSTGEVSASNMMGPLGIVHAGWSFALKGPDWLIWFLAMISANLAVVNFLPIPIVDGGLFIFLILEKIQGKPLSPRMQTAAQIIGLAIILSVFIFATFQDIKRIF